MDIRIFTLLVLIGVLGSFTEGRSVFFDYPFRNDRVRDVNPSADFATWSRLKRAVGDSNGETTTTSQATTTTTPSSTPDTTTDPTTTEPTTTTEPSTTTSPTDTTTTPASTTTEATSSPSTTPTSTTATTPSSTSATTPATTPAESSMKPDVLSRLDDKDSEDSTEKPASNQALGPNYNPFFPTFGPSFDPYYGYSGYNSIPGSNYAWTGTSGGPGYATAGASAGSFTGGYPTIGYPSMGSPAVDNRGGFQDTNAYPGYGTGYSSGGIDPYNSGFYFPGQYPSYDPYDMIRQIQAQIEAQQRANMDFHNRLASEAAKYDGAQLASASIGIGPNGGFQTGQISPAAPGVESRFAEELPAPSGNSYGVFSSSRSSSMTGPDGKQINHKSSTTGINDNGKISFRTVHD